jgi:hypothetical protein
VFLGGWEDLLLTLNGWILNLSLLATIRSRDAAIPRIQSLLVLFTLTTGFAAYVSLGLPGAAISIVFGWVGWIYILLYRNTRTTEPQPNE